MRNAEKKKSGCLGQIILFSVLMGVVLWSAISRDEEKRNETPEMRREKFCDNAGKSAAHIAAKFYVKQELKAPATAIFGSYDERNVSRMGNCEFIIHGHVDAQNSFGALIRNEYYVTLKYDPVRAVHVPINIQIGP